MCVCVYIYTHIYWKSYVYKLSSFCKIKYYFLILFLDLMILHNFWPAVPLFTDFCKKW